jgi:predicted dehydrogenase
MTTSREKLRVAVAGTSFGGNVQIPVFQTHERTRVVAVSSRRLERATSTARNHHIPGVYTDFEEMLDKEKPDLVSIVTPPHLHFPMTLSALSRGIHVLCEKPFALDMTEGQQMKAAADHTAVVAMVDFEFRYVPARAYLVDLVRENFVGEIRMADFIVHLGIRSEPADAPFDWWSDASQGGGLVGAFGSHVMDTLRWILGEPKRLIADVTTFVGQRHGGSVTSDDAFSVLIEFQSGARAAVQMTTVAGVDDARSGVYGNLGQLVIPNIFGTELRGGKRTDKVTSPMEIPQRYLLPQEEGHPLRPPFRFLLNRMIDAIDHNSPSPSPNFEDGLNSQKMLDAARSSVKSGGWVTFETAAAAAP